MGRVGTPQQRAAVLDLVVVGVAAVAQQGLPDLGDAEGGGGEGDQPGRTHADVACRQRHQRLVLDGTPQVRVTALGGLLDVVLHPRFAENRILYLTYAKAGQNNLTTTALARARLDEGTLAEEPAQSPARALMGRLERGLGGQLQ